MMDLNDENDGSTDINMTPMIDCVFLLLIFFLVASTLKKIDKAVPLELPEAKATVQQQDSPDLFVIAVDATGQKYVGGTPVTSAGLITRVREAVAARPDTVIRIDGDRGTAYQNVMAVIDELSFSGFRKVNLKTMDDDHAKRLKQPARK